MFTIEKVAYGLFGYGTLTLIGCGIVAGVDHLRRRKIQKGLDTACERLLNANTNKEIMKASDELVAFVYKNYL